MDSKLFITLLLNVGVLLIISGVLADIKFIRVLLIQKDEKIQNKIILGIMFGAMSITSTYLGLGVQGAIVNTRVIGVLASGILGGPLVGFITSVLAGAHRYLFDINGFTAVACSISTLFEGFLGSMAYLYFEKRKASPIYVGAIAIFAEISQMIIILLVAKPFNEALELVKLIALPMIAINSFGSIMFFSTFNRIFTERESDISYRQSIALHIAEKSLPYLRNGLQSKQSMQEVVNNICTAMPEFRALITNSEEVVADSSDACKIVWLPKIALDAIKEDSTLVSDSALEGDSLFDAMKNRYAIAAPLKESNISVGALIILTKRQWLTMEANKSFVKGLSNLFSTMLELSNISYEIGMRRKAEFRALQSQINPHFLYNALNTLASICREDSERTRELLIVLGDYFRHTLEINREYIPLSDEIKAVEDYLQLEYARFEDRLNVVWDIDYDIDCMLPPLILQPIVENAIKHGADEEGKRNIKIKIVREQDSVLLEVSDKGSGFRKKDFALLLNDENRFSGIFNVHKRLKSIYENNDGLIIKNSNPGASVSFLIPINCLEVKNENSDN